MKTLRHSRYFKSAVFIAAFAVIIMIAVGIYIKDQPRSAHTAQVPESQWQALVAEVQQNGKVNVMVEINSPAWHQLNYSDFEAQHSSSGGIQAYSTAQLTIANEARAALAAAMASYNVTVYRGPDWYVPGVALTVDETGLNFLKNSPLVESMSEDGKAYPGGISNRDEFVTNTPSAVGPQVTGTYYYLEPTRAGGPPSTQLK